MSNCKNFSLLIDDYDTSYSMSRLKFCKWTQTDEQRAACALPLCTNINWRCIFCWIHIVKYYSQQRTQIPVLTCTFFICIMLEKSYLNRGFIPADAFLLEQKLLQKLSSFHTPDYIIERLFTFSIITFSEKLTQHKLDQQSFLF